MIDFLVLLKSLTQTCPICTLSLSLTNKAPVPPAGFC